MLASHEIVVNLLTHFDMVRVLLVVLVGCPRWLSVLLDLIECLDVILVL